MDGEARVIVERRFKIVMLLLAMAVPGSAAAQPAQPGYTLTITREGTPFMTLAAQGAKLSDIAADVARRLNVKVLVAPSLKDERVTAQLNASPIEPAMLALAPRVYVDYEVRKDTQAVPLGIHLLGLEDPIPAVSAVVQGTSQGLLIEGNTEDTGQPRADAPVKVTYGRGKLSVLAKQQPLIAVVMTIADAIGVPAEIKHPSREVIDVDVRDTPVIEEALAGLSENVRVYVRSNANTLERSLLRVVVVGPTPK
jgi:hypothetical protein